MLLFTGGMLYEQNQFTPNYWDWLGFYSAVRLCEILLQGMIIIFLESYAVKSILGKVEKNTTEASTRVK